MEFILRGGIRRIMDLIKNLRDGIIQLDERSVKRMMEEALSSGVDPLSIVEAVRDALTEVGRLYEGGKYYLSDLILAAGMCEDVLKGIAPSSKPTTKGKVVLGTVQGSVHGMGKSIVAALLRSEGYEVYDLGVDVPAERFVEKVRETGAPILGLSVGLVQALPSIGKVVEALKRAGLRDGVKIIVGGNAATPERVLELGCDAYAQSAIAGLKVIDGWMGNTDRTKQS
jgi:dimethylamine corrinoid protein